MATTSRPSPARPPNAKAKAWLDRLARDTAEGA
jgi:hypothetical protein